MTKIIGSAALTAADPTGENLTTKGDLHGYSSENTRIPIGDNDQVLTADSAQALGLKWAAAGGGAVELLDYENFSANANSYTKTFSPALTYDDYGQFMIAISGKADATAASPYIIFSGSASNVYSTGNYNNRTTIAEEVVNGVAPMLLFNATGFGLGNESITSLITFTLNEPANYLTGRMETLNVSTLHSIWNLFEVSASDLSSIEIGMTSTGEFVANTKISMWGIKNA